MRQYRQRRSITLLRLWIHLVLVLLLGTTTAQRQQQHQHHQQHYTSSSSSCAQPPSSNNQNNNYDWEQLNLYEILGFKSNSMQDRSKITTADIKKAYRATAQQYHPDKTRGTNMTTEESNARFTRIANAYQILSDPNKKSDYDQYLQKCEDNRSNKHHQQQQQQQQQNAGAASSFDNNNNDYWSYLFDPMMMSTDPRRVFEEFFFGTSAFSNGGGGGGVHWDDMGYPSSAGTTTSTSTNTPRRIQEHQEVLYDPHSGAEILRVRQTEEYHVDNSDGKYYYRVVAQDFAEQYDPFHHGWSFHPISQPFILEEGYRTHGGRRQDAPTNRKQPSNNNNNNNNKAFSSSNTLEPGEYLFSQATSLLKSENGRYYAGVSPECELLIMSDQSKLGDQVDDVILWTSETFVPPAQNNGCFLTLSGPHLVLVLGSPDYPGNILWHSSSSMSNHDDDDDERDIGVDQTYVARLDNDGRLAVYRRRRFWSEDYLSRNNSNNDNMKKDHWKSWLFHGPRKVPQTRAAKAWESVRRWLVQSVHRQPAPTRTKTSTPPFSSPPHIIRTVESCIYATGVAGCNRPVRKMIHLAADVTYSLKLTLSRMDGVMDNMVEFISGGSGDNHQEEGDDDVWGTLLRIWNKAGHNVLAAARDGAQVVRDTFNKVKSK